MDVMVSIVVLVVGTALGVAVWRLLRGPARNTSVRAIRVAAVFTVVTAVGGHWALPLMNARTYQIAGTIISRVETRAPVVALTFDDGPGGDVPALLAQLDSLDVRATFFVNGSTLTEGLEPTRLIVEAGHDLGNHTYSHPRMIFRSMGFMRSEVERTDSLIRSAGYDGEIHVRAPYGKKLAAFPYYLARTGRTHVTWDVEPDSYSWDRATIVQRTVDRARSGSIILLHVFGVPGSRAAVPEIVGALRARGLRFVTVTELLASDT